MVFIPVLDLNTSFVTMILMLNFIIYFCMYTAILKLLLTMLALSAKNISGSLVGVGQHG